LWNHRHPDYVSGTPTEGGAGLTDARGACLVEQLDVLDGARKLEFEPRRPRRSFALMGVVLGAAVSGAAVADVYRWTDAQGGIHYSNVREDVPAGVEVERLPDGTLPAASAPAAGAGAVGAVEATDPPVAPASLDVERFELQRRYRKASDRLTAIDQQLKALAAAIGGAPEGGEDAVANLEARDTQELTLQRERAALSKRIDGMRTRYAELCRQARAANGGALPVDWELDLR
jgi:hypothetical protein